MTQSENASAPDKGTTPVDTPAPAQRSDRSRARLPLAAVVLAGLAVALGIVAVVVTLNSQADPAEVKRIAEHYAEPDNALGVPLTQSQAECRATVYLESDLSDAALDDVRAGREPRAANTSDTEVLTDLASELAKCL